MRRCHFIGVDVHCAFCVVVAVDSNGQVTHRDRCATSIPALLQEIKKVPRPRELAIEEGPMADWLFRNIHSEVERMIVSNPRHNRLISGEGDKDDPLDAEKLAQLLRGGYLKPVHHANSLARAILKHHVALYHDRVRHRVSEGLRITWLLRRYGIFVRAKHFVAKCDRPALLARLPENRTLAADVRLLWKGYDVAMAQEWRLRDQLVKLAHQEEAVCRFTELPGIGWVRAATLFVWLDTPWRFRDKSALWKYLGIGLERRRSGGSKEWLHVPVMVNRALKGTILGAAKAAVAQGDNPFAAQYRRWSENGLSPKLARRNVARSLAATLWGLWKNGNVYRPEWVGVAGAAVNAGEVSG